MARIDHGAEEALRLGMHRSREWPHVVRAYLLKHPHCACCKPAPHADASRVVQVHHVFPFHYCIALGRADLELDARNLITLCVLVRRASIRFHLKRGVFRGRFRLRPKVVRRVAQNR